MELTETRYEIRDHIATVTLCRPEQMNAFTHTTGKELLWILGEADRDDTVRAIVVTGAGRAFCAGADLSSGGFPLERKDGAGSEIPIDTYRDLGGQVSLAILRCRKPVIGAINGPAVGVGITITLAMDMRIAAEDAKIGFVFARRGVVAEACSAWFLPRIVGIAKATELVYTGRLFRAQEEAGSGLFNYVVPREEVLPRSMSIAEEIAHNSAPVSVSLCKALLWQGLSEEAPHAIHLLDSKCFYWVSNQRDTEEGVQSFLEKRPPRFSMSPTKDMPDFYPWWKDPKIE